MKRLAIATLAPLTVAAALAGCSSSSPAPAAPTSAATTATSAATTASTAPKTSAAATTSPAATAPASSPAAPSGAIQLNKELDDSVLGVKVTVIQAVRGLKPLNASMAGREMVVVQVKVDATKTPYAVTVGDTFAFETSANKLGSMNVTAFAGVPEWMKANGYPPLVAAKRGETQTGWIAGYLNPANDPAPVVSYYQLAFRDNKGGQYPRKDFPVTIK